MVIFFEKIHYIHKIKNSGQIPEFLFFLKKMPKIDRQKWLKNELSIFFQ